MAIYLSRKKGGTVATPITPSNSSPAQMTANVAVNPTANGYAIASYNTKTPSNSSPVALTSGEIDKIGGNGYAISSLEDVIPDNDYPVTLYEGDIYRILFRDGVLIRELYSKTPSDVSPATIVSGGIFQSTSNGYLYATQQTTPTSITPNDSSPVALSANVPVNPTTSGYAIKNAPASKTPSDSSPASVSSGAIIKASASGYLYATQQPKVKTGTFQTSTSGEITVTLGFQPKYLAFEGDGSTSSGKHFMYIYNADTSTSVCYFANASNYPSTRNMTSGANNIVITSTGFKFTMTTSPVRTCRYFAIG